MRVFNAVDWGAVRAAHVGRNVVIGNFFESGSDLPPSRPKCSIAISIIRSIFDLEENNELNIPIDPHACGC